MKTTATIILVVFTIASGIWLSKAGKPYNQLIFTAHKLIALATVAMAAVALFSLFKNSGNKGLVLIAAVILGALFIALFATGAMLSLDKPENKVIPMIHKISPYLTFVFTIALACIKNLK